MLRTRDDAAGCSERLDAGDPRPGAGHRRRVHRLGGRLRLPRLGLRSPSPRRGPAPLVGALGGVIGAVAADLQREHGVDLRCGVTVELLEGDAAGRLRRAALVRRHRGRRRRGGRRAGRRPQRRVAARTPGLAVGAWGVACDAGCRAFDVNGLVTDDVFVAGDVARAPHADVRLPVPGPGALGQRRRPGRGRRAQHGQPRDRPLAAPGTCRSSGRCSSATTSSPSGVPTFADEVVVAQGSVADRRFVAVYGYKGRITGAVTFNQGKWLRLLRAADRAGRAVPAARSPPSTSRSDGAGAADVPDREVPGPRRHRRGHRPRSQLPLRDAALEDPMTTPSAPSSARSSTP